MTDFLFRYRNIVPNLSFMFVNHTRKRHMKINYFIGLIKKETKEVALVFREKQKDFSFPKGHKEEGESLEECAVRETAEETKRIARLIKNFNPIICSYVIKRLRYHT